MSQRYAGMLRRNASELDKREMPVQAECLRQAARHMEELQAVKDAIACPWQTMRTSPMDGTVVLVLLEGSDIPHGVRWLAATDARGVGSEGWHMAWDGHKLGAMDGPRYWMPCPDDPEEAATQPTKETP